MMEKEGTATTLLKSISMASEADKLEKMMLYSQQKVAVILNYPEPQLPDPDRGFFDLGMESLLAIKLQKELEDELGISIPDTTMFNYPTIREIAGFFVELIAAKNKSINGKEEDLPPNIATMSEEEVIRTLNILLPPQK